MEKRPDCVSFFGPFFLELVKFLISAISFLVFLGGFFCVHSRHKTFHIPSLGPTLASEFFIFLYNAFDQAIISSHAPESQRWERLNAAERLGSKDGLSRDLSAECELILAPLAEVNFISINYRLLQS